MTTPDTLSDAALAVFAFAIYHQLESGDPVTKVIADDGKGHHADPKAVAELEELGLAKREANSVSFTPAGMEMIAQLIGRLRGR